MKLLSCKGIGAAAAAIALLAAPLHAQDNGTATAPPDEAIGPGELSGFNLQGTVTQPSTRPTEPAPATRPETTQPAPATAAPPPVDQPATSSLERARPARTSSAPATATTPAVAPPTGASRDTLPPPPAPSANPLPPTPLAPAEDGFSMLPWLAALLLAAGAGAIVLFLRRRSAEAAGVGEIDIVSPRAYAPPAKREPAPTPRPAPMPQPAPVPRAEEPPAALPPEPRPAPSGTVPRHDPVPPRSAAPAPVPAPSPVAAGGGIVSTGLRPWLEVELTPDRAIIDDEGAAIAFNVTLFNSGSAPARDVIIETCLLNAGAAQDAELGSFFGRARPAGDSIPVIAPLARVPLRTAVRLPKDLIREYEVEGRRLFMPMVAVDTRYRWASGEGQTGASFMVGKGGDADQRLAPLRTDQGARAWRELGARRYEKGLRR